ncbi:MAG: type IV toxin-antitoxin system AbiEi family antitoxin [Actinomycetota bacterium]
MKKRPGYNEMVGRLAARGIEMFTLADLRTNFDLTNTQAYQLGHQLARRRLVRRVKPGLYVILHPADWQAGPGAGVDRFWAAANAVRGEPHYLAYYTAMDFHGMIQHPLRTVFVAVERPHRNLMLGTVEVRFVKLIPRKLFGHEERRTAGGHVVRVAQLERTFLDCVDRPDLCGGIEEVFRGFAKRKRDLDHDRLLRFVHRLDKPVLTKRLGFLLEMAGGDPELLLELERTTGRLKRFVPLDKTVPADGDERNSRWELIVNTNLQRLFAAART